MYPSEIYPTSDVPRDALPPGLSRDRLRDICYRSKTQTEDDEFDVVAVTAIGDIERMSGLKLFPGSFEARFPVFRRPADDDRVTLSHYGDGTPIRLLYKRTPLWIPGVNTSSVVVTAPQGPVTPKRAIPDEARNLVLTPPGPGWTSETAEEDPDAEVIVAFTAGGSIPLPILQAIGVQMQWLFNQEPEDEMAARNRAKYYSYRYEL